MDIKKPIYRLSRSAGLFRLARRAKRRGLRILCYHGLSIGDVHEFLPKLFMPPEMFQDRMAILSKLNFPVLDLEEAVQLLKKGTLPHNATVITFDDGFFSQFRYAPEILKKFSFPATLYITTYYTEKQVPIFRLAVRYLFWKSKHRKLETKGIPFPWADLVNLEDQLEKNRFIDEFIKFGETGHTETERQSFAKHLAENLGVDYEELHQSRKLSLMSSAEISSLAKQGFDIQLHTHRHSCPPDADLVKKEVEENRRVLEGIVGRKLHHFCYPSGVWSPERLPWLGSLDIRSATTCDPGLNYQDTPPLALSRFLDATSISNLEFEAELNGFTEILRVCRRGLRG